MAAPSITIVNSSDATIANWDVGTVQANTDSNVLTAIIWNNRGGATALSDLKETNITALDVDGGSSSDVVAGKWTWINATHINGSMSSSSGWQPVGGADAFSLRADGLSASDGYTISGAANDGTLVNSSTNYCTIHIKVHVPLNATPGTKNWKMRLNGYYT